MKTIIRLLSLNILLILLPQAEASFPLWDINEIYSSADGSVQFVEFTTTANGQQFLNGRQLRVVGSGGGPTNSFFFPSNSPSPTANHRLLMATPGFAALPGGVTPDFTIPAGFLPTGGGSLSLVGADTVVYAVLPGDGVTSVNRTGATAANSPENHAGTIGSVNVPPPPETSFTSVSVDAGELTLQWTNDFSRKYDVLFSTDLTASNAFLVAQANIAADPGGINTFTNPPYLASSTFPGNPDGVYQVQSVPLSPGAVTAELAVVVSGLESPVTLTHAGDGSGRLFVLEQRGRILIVDNNDTLLATPFLDISNLMTNLTPRDVTPGIDDVFDERGLLGLAFHPNYAANGRFFIYHSSPKTGPGINHESIVAEYSVSAGDPNIADINATIILRQDQPQFNHNAGTIAFGPDNQLYIAFGDGGGGGDQHGATGNGQDPSNWLGTILRINVDGAAPYEVPADNPFVGGPELDEIWAYGLRNPYKFSFDRGGSNALFCADVGQNIFEEINIIEKGGNYGWRILEGHHAFDASVAATLGVDVTSLKAPIHEYSHPEAGISVTGGFVYRGAAFPELTGRYVFGDFSDGFSSPGGRLYYLEENRPGIWERFQFVLAPANAPLGRFVKGLGEDEDGELYVLTSIALGPIGTTGEILRIQRP